MRQLILVRHAKSSWDNPELNDFERPLNMRGKRDAPFMANLLAEKKVIPDLILSSPAVRTKLTTLEFASKLGISESQILWNDKLYLASSAKLFNILSKVDYKANTIMLVGHNPGLTDLQNLLCREVIENIPTCGIVSMKTRKEWKDITLKDFELDFFEYPKKYFKKI